MKYLLPVVDSRSVGVSYKQKYVYKVMVKQCQLQAKVWTDHLNMTTAIDWDVKPQTQHILWSQNLAQVL